MRRVYKYPLQVSNEAQRVDMSAGSRVVACAMQGPSLCLWALCDPDAAPTRRDFFVVGTGHAIHDEQKANYIGTAFDDHFVWHVFEAL